MLLHQKPHLIFLTASQNDVVLKHVHLIFSFIEMRGIFRLSTNLSFPDTETNARTLMFNGRWWVCVVGAMPWEYRLQKANFLKISRTRFLYVE